MTTTSRGRKFTYNIINTHSYGKENRREHCRRFARLDFCRSCLQPMTSRNTAVYRYRGIFETVCYRQIIPNTVHLYLTPQCYTSGDFIHIWGFQIWGNCKQTVWAWSLAVTPNCSTFREHRLSGYIRFRHYRIDVVVVVSYK